MIKGTKLNILPAPEDTWCVIRRKQGKDGKLEISKHRVYGFQSVSIIDSKIISQYKQGEQIDVDDSQSIYFTSLVPIYEDQGCLFVDEEAFCVLVGNIEQCNIKIEYMKDSWFLCHKSETNNKTPLRKGIK